MFAILATYQEVFARVGFFVVRLSEILQSHVRCDSSVFNVWFSGVPSNVRAPWSGVDTDAAIYMRIMVALTFFKVVCITL